VNVSILEVARPNANPIRPDKVRIMLTALVAGLMAGAGLTLGLNWMDQRLQSADEIQLLLGTPVLGVIPHMPTRDSSVVRGLIVHSDPMSATAEAYRNVRTTVYFGVPDAESKTILITSPEPGDGKSTLASNLAIAMAKSGQRVALVDADFRRPSLHRVFEVSHDVGLSALVAGRVTLEEAMHHTGIDGLDFLPAGFLPANPSEILNSQAFVAVMEKIKQLYDHVVVDAPPVMPVSDSRILGAMCDVTLLVLRAEKSTRKGSQHALEGLLSVGARVLGVVVNDVHRSRHRGYTYGYYGYGGYHRQSGEAEEVGKSYGGVERDKAAPTADDLSLVKVTRAK